MKTTLDMYFRQLWVDPRLEYASNTTLGEEKIIGDAEMAEKIWKPDTFFVNEVSSESKQVLLRIKPSGEVLFSQRIVVCFVSAGNFRNFPWDVNLYTLDFESFGYTMEHFKYGWKDGNKSVQVAFDANVFRDLILAGHRARKVEVSLTSALYRFVAILPAILEVLHSVAKALKVQSVQVDVRGEVSEVADFYWRLFWDTLHY